MRAKFKVASVTNFKVSPEASLTQDVKLHAVYGTDKTNAEDNEFSNATPSGEIRISISNPKAQDFLKPGHSYYVDFTEAQ